MSVGPIATRCPFPRGVAARPRGRPQRVAARGKYAWRQRGEAKARALRGVTGLLSRLSSPGTRVP